LLKHVNKELRPHLLLTHNFKTVQHINGDKVRRRVVFKKEAADALRPFVDENSLTLVEEDIEFGFENLKASEALDMILPKEVLTPTGFETVGHIAHLNLDEEHMPYKFEIGEVFLRKNPKIRTVLTKVGYIKAVYRTFDFEVIAGENTFEACQNEDGLPLHLDIAKVYWCSRLAEERNRVVKEFLKPEETLVDMFCGIGPMAIKAAKAGVRVLANDLNPDCYHYLRKNIATNKVADYVIPYCMDARAFMAHVVDETTNAGVLAREAIAFPEPEQSGVKRHKKKRPPTYAEEEKKMGPEEDRISEIPGKQFLSF